MQIEGITWHGVTLEPDQFSAMKKLCREVFRLTPMIEEEPDSNMISTYGFNAGVVSDSVSTTSKPRQPELQLQGP